MASPRKPPPGWRDYVPDHPAHKVITGAAILTAVLYFFGVLKPVFESGPLPIPSRAELVILKADVEGHIDTLNKSVDQTLEVAKAANTSAQQAISQTNDYRLDRLLQLKIQLEEQIAKNPSDATLKTSLARTNIDIAKLSTVPTK